MVFSSLAGSSSQERAFCFPALWTQEPFCCAKAMHFSMDSAAYRFIYQQNIVSWFSGAESSYQGVCYRNINKISAYEKQKDQPVQTPSLF
jgi:hypothetical protein